MNGKRIRTLVVDDSALVRKIVTESLAPFPEIEVVGTAVDPYAARDKILQLKPDVLTLDIEMPRMDGLTFLRVLMKHYPIPVIIMSSITPEGSAKALEALHAGAVDVIPKPAGAYSAHEDGARLAQSIRAAAGARVRTISDAAPAVSPIAASPHVGSAMNRRFAKRNLILIGASTGGTEAIKTVLLNLRKDIPGICIVQHIPAYFSGAFARRLNDLCQIEVREAKSGDVVCPGLALVAPGGFHMLLRPVGGEFKVELSEGSKIHHQRPAVDALFDSAVKAGVGPGCMAMLLTGMGSDGAEGLGRLREAGALTVAQDEESCVVFGMPREAIRRGAAMEILSLGEMGRRIEKFSQQVAGPESPAIAAGVR